MQTERDLEKLKEKVDEDLKIDRTDLKNEIETNGNKYHRYLQLLMDEKKNMRKLEAIRIKLYRKLYHKFKFGYEFRLKTTNEIETYVNAEEGMGKIQEMINKVKESTDYLEKVLDLFRMRSFALKNLIDYIKLESGGFV